MAAVNDKEHGGESNFMNSPSNRDRWRGSWLLVVAEFAIIAALFVADVYHHVFLSKIPYLFLLGWASLRLRGLRWKDVGFARPRNWGTAIAVGLLSGLFIEVFELLISQPLLARWFGKMPDLSNFTVVHGNLKITLVYLLLIWVLAAFGEELVYRGYLMNRVVGTFHGTRAAWTVSLVVVSVVFGCSHIGQGATGMAENIWDGLLLGTLYLACGRNLAAPTIAHGVTDTVDVLLMYIGRYPGMR
jgi:membrane protease YdiL (CAAX protease family)